VSEGLRTLAGGLLYFENPAQISGIKRADEGTRTPGLLITSELFLLDEQPPPHFLSLRSVNWTAAKVKVGTICVHLVSDTKKLEEPITI
jgi:hypothetical protein